MKKSILIFMGVFALSFNTKAQNGLETVFFADISDANKLVTEFLRPAAEGFIYGTTSTWYHTAKVHKILGFDISIGGSLYIPTEDKKTFDINSLNLSNKITEKPLTSPTILGNLDTKSNDFKVTIPANSDEDINGGNHPELERSFTIPGRFLKSIPTPFIQLSVGLPNKFEATLRLIPKVSREIRGNNLEAKLFGLGVKKEITDLFGVINKSPLHISLMGAFTNMIVTSTIKDPDTDKITITNGSTKLKLNSYTAQAIASLDFPFINVYGGFGYVRGVSSFNITGTYMLEYNGGGKDSTKQITDPLSLEYDISGLTSTIGARVSLGFFKLFGSYTLQEYNTLSAGMVFNIR